MKFSIIIHRIYRYARYWMLKMDQHGLQSPFVFDFYAKCLQSGGDKRHVIAKVEELRNQLISDKSTTVSTLIGNGSSMGAAKGRKITQIAQNGISDINQSSLLINILNQIEAKQVLELGTSLGLNSLYLSHGATIEQVTTIEGNQELARIALTNFDLLAHQPIELLQGDISEKLQYLIREHRQFDLVYIDANHTYEATIKYYHELLSLTDGVLIFDDINWSSGMTQAWKEIKSQSSNRLTIENYNIGIVFLNVKLESANYVLDF